MTRYLLVLSATFYILAGGFGPSLAYADPPMLLVGGIIAAQAADLLTTDMALHHGARELNPIMRATINRYTLKVATATFTSWAVCHLWATGHREAAVLVAITHIAVYGNIAVYNLQVAQENAP